jgi:hypothetical protein
MTTITSEESKDVSLSKTHESAEEEARDCPICFDEITSGTPSQRLPCQCPSEFHVACIVKMLAFGHTKCPTCRADLPTKNYGDDAIATLGFWLAAMFIIGFVFTLVVIFRNRHITKRSLGSVMFFGFCIINMGVGAASVTMLTQHSL